MNYTKKLSNLTYKPVDLRAFGQGLNTSNGTLQNNDINLDSETFLKAMFVIGLAIVVPICFKYVVVKLIQYCDKTEEG